MPVTMFGKKLTAFQQKHLIPTIQHGCAELMILACYVATGSGHLAVTESTMNSIEEYSTGKCEAIFSGS